MEFVVFFPRIERYCVLVTIATKRAFHSINPGASSRFYRERSGTRPSDGRLELASEAVVLVDE